jgi:hypothetical protein
MERLLFDKLPKFLAIAVNLAACQRTLKIPKTFTKGYRRGLGTVTPRRTLWICHSSEESPRLGRNAP